MKSTLLKSAMVVAFFALTLGSSQAQTQKMGDNLGNHTATRDLQLAGKQILNASGVVIGATVAANNSVALQISGADRAILISNVVANADILAPLNGMIIYNTTDNKFYLYQNGAWVTFALALTPSTNGIESASNPNGYTLTQVGQETVLKLAPADATNPGVITTGDQNLAGNKTLQGNFSLLNGGNLTVEAGTTNLNGNLTVGAAGANVPSVLNGSLTVSDKTTLNGNTGTASSPVNGIVFSNTVPALNTEAENFLVVDAASGEVRRSSFVGNALFKQRVLAPTITLGANEATKLVLTVPGITQNDGVVVNYDATDLASTPGLEYISILNATATNNLEVSITIADMRQENADGTPLIPATTLLSGKNFIITRYKQTP
ncbi:hypothetical protein G6M26_27330 [Agrobacterium tumefaciens]|nr:hypothetical protein [Agrobacterium tumefaciens]NTE22268.1 hypothetical protein [Agrobacterium tumefaciens]